MRVLVPFLREVPIWTYGPIYDRLDGRYFGEGWSPSEFGQWEFASEEDARAALKAKRVNRAV